MIETTSLPPIDWKDLSDKWCDDSFFNILEITINSPNQGKTLFKDYGWEIFDKVFEHSLSSTSCCLEHLLRVVEVLGLNCRPRELYIMVVEKLAGGSVGGLRCLTILFYSMQLALLGLPSGFNDGLSLVLKAIVDFLKVGDDNQAVSLLPNADFSKSKETAIEIALSFFESIACRSKLWYQYHDNIEGENLVETLCSDNMEIQTLTSNESVESHHDQCIVNCLLQICSQCIVNIKETEKRASFMQKIIMIITRHLDLSLESILKEPYRVHHFLYTTMLSDIQSEKRCQLYK
jgi:hypothetical protein